VEETDREKRMSRQWLTRCASVLAGALMLLAAPPAARADEPRFFVAPLDEIPVTSPLVTGARAAGMGFVCMAVADDGSAITSNPATMARLNRAELSGAFMRSAFAIEGERLGDKFATDLSGTDFASFRFAYPFPTFRGSLVLGLSAERIYDFSDRRVAGYTETLEGSGDVWSSVENYFSDGSITALSAACALDISPTISLGVTFSYLTGDYSKSFVFDDVYQDPVISDRYDSAYHHEDQYQADISGVRGTIGSLFYVSEQLSVGVAIDTPTPLTYDGSGWAYEVEDSAVVVDTSVLFSDKITLPFAFRGGVAYAPLDFIVVGVDLSYSDWSEMRYVGPITTEIQQGDDGVLKVDYLYKETLGYGIGAEVTIPSWPLRLRGGYVHRPMAYNGLTLTRDRSYYTFGAGILIDTVLAVDVAWMQGTYEREDTDFAYCESVETSALIVEATYRF
jgi:long-subunit fatty acid transport protein